MIHEVKNPIINHKLAQLRNKNTASKDFRELVEDISMLLTYEVAKNFETQTIEIETPIKSCNVEVLNENNFVVVPILRAGLAMAGGVLKMLPNASIGHVGLYRDEKTFEPVEYFFKMPPDFAEKILIVVDPMLATGGSASAALQLLKNHGAKKIYFLCIVSAPRGIEKLSADHPDIPIYTASIDEGLNKNCYIVPGLGDAGDRIFATLK
ncbi:MAG: uracil phosphoribosyltransferase [Selenomonadaceae bacterium]|nr:uracil phosphoribosyltransferase [Selenomonadaceae bacterium]